LQLHRKPPGVIDSNARPATGCAPTERMRAARYESRDGSGL